MQSHYLEQFDREMGCTQAEWLSWLPQAFGEVAWQVADSGQSLDSDFKPGQLNITWRTGEPRRIALLHMPRLHVSFRFTGVEDVRRNAFMKRFDLFMQRGGG